MTLPGGSKIQLFNNEVAEFDAHLVAQFAEQFRGIHAGADMHRIGIAFVHGFFRAGENGTDFARAVADRNHEIYSLKQEFVDAFGAVIGRVNAEFRERGHSHRMHVRGVRTRGKDFDTVSQIRPQESFGHLTAHGITGADNEYFGFGHY